MSVFFWLEAHWEMICIAFGVLVNALGLAYNVYKLCRSPRGKRAEDWIAVLEAARGFEREAEAITAYTAAEKLQYVLARLNEFMAERGCDFEQETLIAQIEADIAFSKEVNARKSERLE